MAISRREIIKLGVSYGSGAINFGNDSVAFERALRKLPQDTHLAEFLDELERVTEVLAAEEAAAEAAAAEAEAADEEVAEDAAEPTLESETSGQEPISAEEPAAEPEPEAEAPHENPLAGAIEKAFAFRSFCASLALGELFVQTTALITTMREECLPAVEDIDKLKAGYNAIADYLQHH